ncbi:interleukin-20 receptor subunit alpha [Xiphias gladius]|uniref:interleukin-20 receptor subunit alpha n=1 Tax=Xiphias gladius TaxID=8245 RepID=UPI001A99AB28|nr:interleukin-20 receptor subunit alpha [Xiphias gladius]
MWTLLVFLNLGVLHCTVSSTPPSPINVVFSSVNLRNVLHWSPGNSTPEDTHFTVQYAIYGDSVKGSKGRQINWRAVRQCTEIVRSWCDLSNETWDQEQGYHARVCAVGKRASSKWAMTHRRFDPKSDTSFGPPLVSVEIEGNNAIITLKGPVRYQPNNQTPVGSMATLYPQMTYNLSVHNIRRGQIDHFQVVSSPYKYPLMDHKTEYCFSAKTRFLSMPVQCLSSAWHCITSPQDPVIAQMQRVVWGIVAPSLCMCVLMVVGYFLRNYLMGKGQKSPYILNPPSFQPPLMTFSPENFNLILISVIKDEPGSETDNARTDPACPKRQQHNADPPPRYSPQRPEAPSELDDLSIDYGFVGVAPKIDVIGEGDSYENNEWRAEDGHSAGVYAPRAKSYLSQMSTHTCTQTHMPIHSQTHSRSEKCTLVQAQPWSHLKSVLLTQIQGSLPSFQGATKREVDKEEEDRECRGLCLNKNPQTGLYHVPVNLQAKKEVGRVEEMDRKVRVRTDGKIDGAVKEGGESDQVALLSAYIPQSIKYTPTSHPELSDFLQNDYGLATAHSIEEDEEEEEEEGTHIIWDPETRKLVLPEMAMEFSKEGGLVGSMQGEEGSQGRMEGEEEEVKAVKGKLKWDNVFVTQASEEEAEALREMERGGETGWEENDILNKWNLVISMDQ